MIHRNLKRRVQVKKNPMGAKLKLKKGSGSEVSKATCAIYGKRHYGECLLGTGSIF